MIGGLEMADIRHGFAGTPVVNDVSLSVSAGEIVCLLGPSGCGKTTLLRVAAGLETPRQGRVLIGGVTVTDVARGVHVPPEDRRVGLMFQDYALFPHLTVADNIAFGAGAPTPERDAWISRSLDRMGMASLANMYPHTLSGGEQQRTALLRALAPAPLVLLLDEPFSGLDASRRAQVRDQTVDILRESRVATLLVTHDAEEAMAAADRMLVMEDGRLVQTGTPAEIYLRPTNPFVAGLFGHPNRFSAVVRGSRVETPVGAFAAGDLPDGAAAQVLIRPESIGVAADGTGIPAVVRSARLLGRASRLTVAVDGLDEPLRMQVHGMVLPETGAPIALRIDAGQVFIFAD